MDKNRLGSLNSEKAKFFKKPKTKTELVNFINTMGEEGLSFYEIQSLLREMGVNVNTNNIRTILSK